MRYNGVGLHCQETGGKFSARTSRKTKSKYREDDNEQRSGAKGKGQCDKMWSPENGDGDDGDESDTFSDLYPGILLVMSYWHVNAGVVLGSLQLSY